MDTFRIIVLAIATIVLVLILVMVGILLSKGNTNKAFPPNYGECPDYWVYDDKEKKCIIPEYNDIAVNVGNMYGETPEISPILSDNVTNAPGFKSILNDKNETVNYIDFNDSTWGGVCDKKKWATVNGIVWDGISNYNNC